MQVKNVVLANMPYVGASPLQQNNVQIAGSNQFGIFVSDDTLYTRHDTSPGGQVPHYELEFYPGDKWFVYPGYMAYTNRADAYNKAIQIWQRDKENIIKRIRGANQWNIPAYEDAYSYIDKTLYNGEDQPGYIDPTRRPEYPDDRVVGPTAPVTRSEALNGAYQAIDPTYPHYQPTTFWPRPGFSFLEWSDLEPHLIEAYPYYKIAGQWWQQVYDKLVEQRDA